MNYSEKYILVPLNQKTDDKCKTLISKFIQFYKEGKVNDDLNIKIQGEFKKETNVIDYLLDVENKLPFSKEFKMSENSEEINKREEIYSKKSPVQLRVDKNKKWIH